MDANVPKSVVLNSTVNVSQMGVSVPAPASAPAAITSQARKCRSCRPRCWPITGILATSRVYLPGLLSENVPAKNQCAAKGIVSASVQDWSAQSSANVRTARMVDHTSTKILSSRRISPWPST